MSNKGRNIRIRTAESESSGEEGPVIRPGSGNSQSRLNKPPLSTTASSLSSSTSSSSSKNTTLSSSSKILNESKSSSAGLKKLGPSFTHDQEDEDNVGITKIRLAGKSNIPISSTTLHSTLPIDTVPSTTTTSNSKSKSLAAYSSGNNSTAISSVSDYSNEGLARLRANQLYAGNTGASTAVTMDIDETMTTMNSDDIPTTTNYDNDENNDDDNDNGVDIAAIQIAQAKAAREALRRKNAFNGPSIDDGIHEPSSGLYNSDKWNSSSDNVPMSTSNSSMITKGKLDVHRVTSDDNNEIDEWEQSLLNRGKGGKQYSSIEEDIQKEYSMRLTTNNNNGTTKSVVVPASSIRTDASSSSSSINTVMKGITLRPLPDPSAQLELLQQKLHKVSLTYQQKTTSLNHDLSRTETELEDIQSQIITSQQKISTLSPTFDFFQTFRLWFQECVQCLKVKSPLIVTLETAIDNYFSSIEKLRRFRRTMDMYDEIQEEKQTISSNVVTEDYTIHTMEVPIHSYATLQSHAEQHNISSSSTSDTTTNNTMIPSSGNLPTVKTILYRDTSARQGARLRRRNRIKMIFNNIIDTCKEGKITSVLESSLFTVPKSSSPVSVSSSVSSAVSFSDGEESDDENTSNIQQITNLQRAQSLLFKEITKDYTTVDGILHRFSTWKSNSLHARTYIDSFAYLALPEILSPLVHYQLCLWYPIPLSKNTNMNPQSTSLESFEFFNSLLHYTDIPINVSSNPSVVTDRKSVV